MAKSFKKAKMAPLATPPAAEQNPQSTSVAPAPPTFDTFTCFSRLPIELRLIVWSMTVEPRKVTVVCDPNYVRPFKAAPMPYVGSIAKVPLGLHVSQESRRQVLKSYQLWLSTKRLMRSSHGVYFNPFMDALILNDFSDEYSLPDLLRNNWNIIKSPEYSAHQQFRIPLLGFDGGSSYRFSWFARGAFEHLTPVSFENVERMFFIVHTGTGGCSHNSDVDWFCDVGYQESIWWQDGMSRRVGETSPTGKIISEMDVIYCNNPPARRWIRGVGHKWENIC